MKISLVVPVFNEQEAIPVFYERVRGFAPLHDHEVEIVFVNDGSRDETLAIIDRLAHVDPLVVAVDLTRNFGKEAALYAGLEIAGGDAVIPIDVDLQDPIEVIPLMIGRWLAGADVVLGKRRERSSDSRLKRGTASLFYKFHNAISHPRIEENVGDFRLLSRQTVECIKQMPERNIFMKGILSWVGGRTEIVEYSRPARVAGASKFNGWKLWNLALEGITSFSTLPLRIWTYIGLSISLVSIAYAFWMAADKLVNGNPVPGYPSLITAILFLGGVQIIGIGVIGEYIGRIYIESKRRPRYLIREVIGRQDIQPARRNASKRHLRPVEIAR